MTGSLLEIRNLKTHFPYVGDAFPRRVTGHVRAVDGVTLGIRHGEILGLVGESGCGKSTLARTVVGLEKVTSGSIELEGRELGSLSRRQLAEVRSAFQMIFQDPFSSLNPRMTVLDALSEPIRYHGLAEKGDCAKMVSQLMDAVGLPPRDMRKYPHEFSGGQRQRIAIARALALRPKLIIADEPVSALDVSIRSQILNLLLDLTGGYRLTLLLISHDLSVVRHIADRTAVMYLGRIVESGGSDRVFTETKHPYTEALLSAVPIPDPDRERDRKRILMTGDPPSALDPPSGCRFHPRCRYAEDRCREMEPELEPKGHDHLAACFFSDRVSTV